MDADQIVSLSVAVSVVGAGRRRRDVAGIPAQEPAEAEARFHDTRLPSPASGRREASALADVLLHEKTAGNRQFRAAGALGRPQVFTNGLFDWINFLNIFFFSLKWFLLWFIYNLSIYLVSFVKSCESVLNADWWHPIELGWFDICIES